MSSSLVFWFSVEDNCITDPSFYQGEATLDRASVTVLDQLLFFLFLAPFPLASLPQLDPQAVLKRNHNKLTRVPLLQPSYSSSLFS